MNQPRQPTTRRLSHPHGRLSRTNMVVAAWLSMLGLTLAGAGCEGLQGTIAIDIVTAPGSTVMTPVASARLTLSEPHTVFETERGADGRLVLELEVEAQGIPATVTFEGFDDSGTLIAYGRTPPLPIAALDANVAVYVARPMTIAAAPLALDSPRTELGVTPLAYGVAIAGGRDAAGDVSSRLDIYNAYTHQFQAGADMPEARAGLTLLTGLAGDIYLFGGQDAADQPSATAWRFATGAPPTGVYSSPFATDSTLARTGARGTILAGEQFIVTGAPAVQIDGIRSTVTAYPDAPTLDGTATTMLVDGGYVSLFVGAGNGDGGGYVLDEGEFIALSDPGLQRTGHGTVGLPDAVALTLAGRLDATGMLDNAGVVVDMRSREVSRVEGLLDTPRTAAAVTATPEYVLVAGGEDDAGVILDDAEIVDATTLEPVTVLPLLVPRTDARAVALANGQIMVVGGVDAACEPIATIELFTPGL